MRDERGGVNLSCFNKSKNFLAIATIHATSLKGEVLSVHLGQRKDLRLVVEGHRRYDGIGAGTLPRKSEGIVSSGHFKHTVGSTVVAMLQDKVLALFGVSKRSTSG